MKKLLFSVAGAATLTVIFGCGTIAEEVGGADAAVSPASVEQPLTESVTNSCMLADLAQTGEEITAADDDFEFSLSSLYDYVDVEDWPRVERGICENFKIFSDKGEFEALKRFLAEYPLFHSYSVEGDTMGLELGTDEVNAGIGNLTQALQDSMVSVRREWCRKELTPVLTNLVGRVVAAVEERRFAEAIAAVRDEKPLGHRDLDIGMYVLSMGVLKSLVNPALLENLLAEMEECLAEFRETRDFAGMFEYVEDYPQVVDEPTALGRAVLAELGQAPEQVEAERGAEYLGMFKAEVPMKGAISTREINERLRRRLEQARAEVDAGLEMQKRIELIKSIGTEICLDSQIALAVDAISKQLACTVSFLQMNSVLGEYERVMRLLKKGEAIDDAQATTMFIGAVYLNQRAVMDWAVKLGADVNGVSSRDPLKRGALLVAIQMGHVSLLGPLAEAGVKFDSVDARGDGALHYAVCLGDVAAVKTLLKLNDVNYADLEGEPAIFVAARRNNPVMVKLLLEANAEVKKANKRGQTVMDAACAAGARDVLDVLVDAGAKCGPGQLRLAAEHDYLGVAQWLVGQGVDVNAPGVMEACEPGSKVQMYLLHHGGEFKLSPERVKALEEKKVLEKVKVVAEDEKR